jgi:DNA-binding PadR family transcriptional regulator
MHGEYEQINGCGPSGRKGGGPRGRHARHRHPGGPGGFGGAEFGFGGPGFGRGRRRMRRGDVRAAILVLLDEGPRNGYGMIQEIESRSDGAWRPSPGSVYPALALLEDEGLVKAEAVDGGKQFTLTESGVKHVAENREKLGEPWANLSDGADGPRGLLRNQIKPLIGAVGQIMQVGGEDDVKRTAEILADARRKIYGILAEDDQPSGDK